MRDPATTREPPPTGEGPSVTDWLCMWVDADTARDLRARREVGRAKYGTELRAHNGRDALTDAYQEALDLCAYLAQANIETREHEVGALVYEAAEMCRTIRQMIEVRDA